VVGDVVDITNPGLDEAGDPVGLLFVALVFVTTESTALKSQTPESGKPSTTKPSMRVPATGLTWPVTQIPETGLPHAFDDGPSLHWSTAEPGSRLVFSVMWFFVINRFS
jgi:hypothetical protein